jgi:hypothetical protein
LPALLFSVILGTFSTDLHIFHLITLLISGDKNTLRSSALCNSLQPTAETVHLIQWLGCEQHGQGIMIWFPRRARDFSLENNVQTGSRGHQTWWHSGIFLCKQSSQGVKLTTHLHPVHGITSPLHVSPQHGASLIKGTI